MREREREREREMPSIDQPLGRIPVREGATGRGGKEAGGLQRAGDVEEEFGEF